MGWSHFLQYAIIMSHMMTIAMNTRWFSSIFIRLKYESDANTIRITATQGERAFGYGWAPFISIVIELDMVARFQNHNTFNRTTK